LVGTQFAYICAIGAHNGADINKGYKHMSTLSRYTRDEFLTPFDRLFDDVFNSFGVTPYAGSYTKNSYPKVDVVEYDDKYVLEADVAGLTKEDVSVDLEGDTLVIRGGKKTNNENTTKGKYLYKEIKRSSFTRSFSVSEGIDKNKIKADFTNGTIKVDLPKLKIEEQRPKTHKLL
jgi:HSP20 family protein